MAEVTLQGKTVRTHGSLPDIGDAAPDFLLVATDLSDVRLSDFAGSRIVMNIFPSIETVVCAESVRRFNEMADRLDNTRVLGISRDLPFAHERFITREGIDNVVALSEMRNNEFGERYGLRIMDGPFAGLLSRAVIVLDEHQRVMYTQLVPEIGEEPDYEGALQAAESASVPERKVSVEAAPPDDFCNRAQTGEHARLENEDEACDEGRAGKV